MLVLQPERSLSEELFYAEDGFYIENPYNNRSITVVNEGHQRYQMAKGGMIAGYTNHESVACNFIHGG